MTAWKFLLSGASKKLEFIGGWTYPTASLPAHQTGDIIITARFRWGNTSAPAAPSGYTLIKANDGGSGSNSSMTAAYKIATSAAEAVPGWADDYSIAAIFRNQHVTTPLGSSTPVGSFENIETLTYPALTPTDGNAFILAFGAQGENIDMGDYPPSGMEVVYDNGATPTRAVALFKTPTEVASWPSTDVTTFYTTGWNTIVFELNI
jgi:hypothetical protein